MYEQIIIIKEREKIFYENQTFSMGPGNPPANAFDAADFCKFNGSYFYFRELFIFLLWKQNEVFLTELLRCSSQIILLIFFSIPWNPTNSWVHKGAPV